MDNRTARRAAEKAARDLIAARAALIGELGVLQTEHARLTDDAAQVAARGRQLVADAEAEAARLLATAHGLTRDNEQRYSDAYTAAAAAGWTPADLAALGYQPTTGSTAGGTAGSASRRRRPQPDPNPELAAAPSARLPDQHSHPDRTTAASSAH